MSILIKKGLVVNEGRQKVQDILIEGQRISRIDDSIDRAPANVTEINAEGKIVIPGMIDDQVHFRQPGLTHKGDIASESRAAIAGGITSYMDMPNTKPPTLNNQMLHEKLVLAAKNSWANYAFYLGASNDNYQDLISADTAKACGIKIFMGSSTGNMLVDDVTVLEKIFANSPLLIVTHCEDEKTIQKNLQTAKQRYGEDVPIEEHPHIRSEQACYLSSSYAVSLAKKFDSRLHILHLSTAKELALFDHTIPLSQKKITGEVCVHHLYFNEQDYKRKGSFIKWNPSIKSSQDQIALQKAVTQNTLDVIATDHAPHTIEEKNNRYFSCPSGGPLVQHALPALMQLYKNNLFSLETIVAKTSHNVAQIYQIKERGFLRESYFADIAIIEPHRHKISKENILYKCGWSPFEDETFDYRISHTILNGSLAYNAYNQKQFSQVAALPLEFERS